MISKVPLDEEGNYHGEVKVYIGTDLVFHAMYFHGFLHGEYRYYDGELKSRSLFCYGIEVQKLANDINDYDKMVLKIKYNVDFLPDD